MRNITNRAMMIGLGAVCLSGLLRSARADDVTVASAPVAAPSAAGQDEDKWKFTSPLYLWGSGVNGDINFNGNSVHVDLPFDKVLDHIDLSIQVYAELSKPQYGFYAQPNYLKLSADGSEGPIKVNDDLQLWIVEFGGFYRIWHSDSDRPANLYALAGGRYWNIHNDLTIKNPLGNTSVASTTWMMDPIVGLRFTEYFTKRLHVWMQADVGGFGISEDTSRFSWQVMPLLGYDFTMPVIKKPSTVFAGWRQINVQYLNGGGANSFDITFSGVLVGLNVNLF
jgi:hypothetical protein